LEEGEVRRFECLDGLIVLEEKGEEGEVKPEAFGLEEREVGIASAEGGLTEEDTAGKVDGEVVP
jgi:hypothetical protein